MSHQTTALASGKGEDNAKLPPTKAPLVTGSPSSIPSAFSSWSYKFHLKAQEWMFVVIRKVLMNNQNLEVLLPYLETARRVSADSYGPNDKVSLSACGSYKIIQAQELLQNMQELSTIQEALKDSIHQEKLQAACDKLLEMALPHIRELSSTSDISLDDCYYYCCVVQEGGYLPVIHTDTDWLMFPEHDGFQLWYLLENDHPDNQGNMFMIQTDALSPKDPPVHIEVSKDGSKFIKKKADQWTYPVMETFRHEKDKGDEVLKFEYLDMKPGDCMLMSKHSLHMSDPRPHLLASRKGKTGSRRAVALRIVLKNPSDDGFLRFNSNHPYVYYSPLHASLKKRVFEENAKELPSGSRQLRLKSRLDMFDPRGEISLDCY